MVIVSYARLWVRTNTWMWHTLKETYSLERDTELLPCFWDEEQDFPVIFIHLSSQREMEVYGCPAYPYPSCVSDNESSTWHIKRPYSTDNTGVCLSVSMYFKCPRVSMSRDWAHLVTVLRTCHRTRASSREFGKYQMWQNSPHKWGRTIHISRQIKSDFFGGTVRDQYIKTTITLCF